MIIVMLCGFDMLFLIIVFEFGLGFFILVELGLFVIVVICCLLFFIVLNINMLQIVMMLNGILKYIEIIKKV